MIVRIPMTHDDGPWFTVGAKKSTAISGCHKFGAAEA